MKKSYIKMTYQNGIDWHDTYSRIEQIKWNGKYEVDKSDLLEIVCYYTFKYFPPMKDHEEEVKKAIYEGKAYSYPVCSGAESNTFDEEAYMITIAARTDENTIEMNGWYECVSLGLYFDLYFVEEGKERFWVTEDFLAPFKGCTLAERLYHESFDTAEEAEAYCEELRKKISETAVKAGGKSCYNFETKTEEKEYVDKIMKGSVDFTDDVRGIISSFPSLKIHDIDKIKSNEWYKNQKLAMDLMKKNNVTPFSNPNLFSIDASEQIKLLSKSKIIC